MVQRSETTWEIQFSQRPETASFITVRYATLTGLRKSGLSHPSHHLNAPKGQLNTTLVGINTPTRIGKATAMPGDVVLERDGVVMFIPPHLAEKVVKTSEVVRLRDMFGHQRLREQKYTPGQIDSRWSDEIEKDFSKWLTDHINDLPVPKEQIQELLKSRTW